MKPVFIGAQCAETMMMCGDRNAFDILGKFLEWLVALVVANNMIRLVLPEAKTSVLRDRFSNGYTILLYGLLAVIRAKVRYPLLA